MRWIRLLADCASPRGSADNEAGAHHALHHLIAGDGAFHLTDKDVGGLLAHHHAALLHSGKHRIAGDGTLTIGESAYRHIIRDAESHVLGGIEDTDGSVVVDGEESVRTVGH